jgi:hypothetical protein
MPSRRNAFVAVVATLSAAVAWGSANDTPIALAQTTNAQWSTQPWSFDENAPSAGGAAGSPLSIADSSHIAILEYEAWFGPNAVTFQDAEAMPLLQSADMKNVGGGYDSEDPHVIKQHVAWMQYMGIDAASIDVTNNVGCIFSTGPVSRKFCNPSNEQFRQNNRQILANTGNLYPAWTALRTPLKLVPLLGCQTWLDLAIGSDGKSGFQKEVEYFGRLAGQYPALNVRYLGHPLMMMYTGTPVNPNLLSGCLAVLHRSGLDQEYTIRTIAGYLDSQSTFWADPNEHPHGPIEISPRYRFWSVVDRLKPSYALYPTYSVIPGTGGRVENLTASLATAGQSGWGCPEPTYCPDDALRYGSIGTYYKTLADFMAIACQLQPRFLIVDQFNEFSMSDEGWNADTSDDAEPTHLPQGWAYNAIRAIHDDISTYRQSCFAR